MGPNNSKYDAASYAKGKKRQNPKVLHQIPLDFHHLLKAKTIESYAATAERGTAAVKNATDGYTNFQNGRAYRESLKANDGIFRESIPTIQACSFSLNQYFHNRDWIRLLKTFLTGVEVVAFVLEVFSGKSELEKIGIRIASELEAQTGLDAPEKFSVRVYNYIKDEASTVRDDEMRHVYFLYHPDTDWHPEFKQQVLREALPVKFLGMSENLDSLVVWMKFLRQHMSATKFRFHLLIPAYRVMFIANPLKFPDLGPLTIHGQIHNGNYYVWFNLPTLEDYRTGSITLSNVGNMAQGDSKYRGVAAAGTMGGGICASMAATVCLTPLFPPAIVLAPLGFVASTYGGQCVYDYLSKKVPRVLGEPPQSGESSDEEEEDGEDREPVIIQPATRHVKRSKRRHDSSHRPSRR